MSYLSVQANPISWTSRNSTFIWAPRFVLHTCCLLNLIVEWLHRLFSVYLPFYMYSHIFPLIFLTNSSFHINNCVLPCSTTVVSTFLIWSILKSISSKKTRLFHNGNVAIHHRQTNNPCKFNEFMKLLHLLVKYDRLDTNRFVCKGNKCINMDQQIKCTLIRTLNLIIATFVRLCRTCEE